MQRVSNNKKEKAAFGLFKKKWLLHAAMKLQTDNLSLLALEKLLFSHLNEETKGSNSCRVSKSSSGVLIVGFLGAHNVELGGKEKKSLNMCVMTKLKFMAQHERETVQYLHGIALAVHSVLRAGDGGAVTPVQVELQAFVGLGQISS